MTTKPLKKQMLALAYLYLFILLLAYLQLSMLNLLPW
jgi:hypothetical protein